MRGQRHYWTEATKGQGGFLEAGDLGGAVEDGLGGEVGVGEATVDVVGEEAEVGGTVLEELFCEEAVVG